MNKLLLLLPLLLLLSTASVDLYAKKHFLVLPRVITQGSLIDHAKVLNQANQWDEVHISTDSYGGLISEMFRMFSALKSTKAKTVCYVENMAASSAAILTVSCSEFHMKQGAILLFHMPRNIYEIAGKPFIVDVITYDDWCPYHAEYALQFEAFFIQIGVPRYLTEEQWIRLIEGDDIMIGVEDLKRRLQGL